ncbi:circularly permuted type 2 ATP-grasp protein, partial [Microcystis wesenbergii FACHB-1339]|nr:circularly permuted type 2 ATP-grasp protein [Microcystis wesenbergii FACHB-1339]
MLLNTYDPEGFYDELFLDDGQPRPHASPLIKWLQNLPPRELQQHRETAQSALFE